LAESKDEDEIVPSMDTQESSVRRSFRPLVPQDDEDDDALDMDDVGDDNLVETEMVSINIKGLVIWKFSLDSYKGNSTSM